MKVEGIFLAEMLLLFFKKIVQYYVRFTFYSPVK